MNSIRKWAIACYEFLFAEPGTTWRDVIQQKAIESERDRADQTTQLPFVNLSTTEYGSTADYFLLGSEEIEDNYEDYEDCDDYEGYEDYDEEDDESETDLGLEDYGLVHYRIQALGGDTFIEFSYEDELDEAAIVQALTYLWQTTPHPNNQIAGTLRLPIAPAYPVQYSPFS